MEPPLRLGLFMMPLHPLGRPMHAYLAEDTEKALLMEKLGFDELFIGEHYSAATEPYPSPWMLAASLLPRTERLVFATGVVNAPLHHPAMIAAEAAQFDHLSKGRFILGIGSGSTPTDAEMMNVPADPRERGAMLAEAIEMIERIWASDPPYELEGKYWSFRIKDTINPALHFGWLPKPYQKPRPPIAIPSSTPDSASVRVAGRKGWSVISSALLSTADLARHWAMYGQGCEEAGRLADGKDWRVCRTVHIAATDEEARAHVYAADSGYRHFYGHMHTVYRQLGRLGVFKSRPEMRDDEVTVDTMIEQRTIFGSPKTVLAELSDLQRTAGPFGTLLLSAVDWSGRNAAWERESWSRLTADVMPALRSKIAAA
jgi:alkanesulfonate monooxygenase SsuD/methylene tetrahydromethanopterin reductase-like flavin-dependent oxidoreductase (luciferase family)